MPTTKKIPLKKLLLDQANPRIQAVDSQAACIQEIYDDKPNQFKELLSSINNKGFFFGETILVMPHPEIKGKYIVKEGNRRISALKILHGGNKELQKNRITEDLKNYIRRFPHSIKRETTSVFCTIFEEEERSKLDDEIATRHLSGTASRLDWPPVRKAKKERQKNGKYNPALDLLERYLEEHSELTEQWEVRYPFTILEEFVKPLSSYLGYTDATALSMAYPDPATVETIDKLICNIYDNPDGSGIRDVENRRKNAQNYLTQHYVKPTSTVSTEQKVGPYERSTITEPQSTISSPELAPPRLKRRKEKDPALEIIKSIITLSGDLPNDGIKLYDACKEFHDLIRSKKYPIASGILLRSLLDYILRISCKSFGYGVNEKTTMGSMLNQSKNVIQDREILALIDKILNSHIDALHAYVHSPFITPSPEELRSQITIFLPIIKQLIELTIQRKKKQNQMLQDSASIPAQPLEANSHQS